MEYTTAPRAAFDENDKFTGTGDQEKEQYTAEVSNDRPQRDEIIDVTREGGETVQMRVIEDDQAYDIIRVQSPDIT